jgi:hypothetical protein
MAEKGFKRKLTAIFIADVKGNSRLIGKDEGLAVRALCTYLTSKSFKLLKSNSGGHKNEMPRVPV